MILRLSLSQALKQKKTKIKKRNVDFLGGNENQKKKCGFLGEKIDYNA